MRRPPSRPISPFLLALSVSLLSAACATTPAPVTWGELTPAERESLFLTQAGHGAEGCWSSAGREYPVPRSLEPVLDSTALVERLREAWSDADGSVLLHTQVDTAFVRLRALESSLGDTRTASLVEEVRPHLGLRGTESRWTGRIRVELGDEPRLRAGYSVECAASLANRQEVANALANFRRAIPETDFPVRRDSEGITERMSLTVVGRYQLSEDGSVLDATVQRSSGRPRVDALVEAVSDIVRFRPAMVDGEPVSVWVEFPITVRP